MKILVAQIINDQVAQVRVTTQDFFDSNPERYPGEWKVVGEEDHKNVMRLECGKGSLYLRNKEKFIEPKPFDNWVLDNEKDEWTAPKKMPKDGNDYYWDDKTSSWIRV